MHLLTSQLESQRRYWEEQVSRVEAKSEKEGAELKSQLKVTLEKCEDLDKKVTSCCPDWERRLWWWVDFGESFSCQ